MIWDSAAARTIVDLVIIGLTLASLLALHKDRQTVRRLGLISSVEVIYSALLLIGLFYLADLLIMHALPLITSHAYATRIMKELHLNWSWFVFLIAVSVIAVGLTHLVRTVAPKVVSSMAERERAEEELSRIRDELEVRVKERTRALQVEITEHTQAEKALRQTEERFRNLIEGSIQGIIIQRDLKPLFVNQAYSEMLGYNSPAEILAMESIEKHFAVHERARLRGYKEARFRGEDAPSQYEYEALRKDGTIVTLQNSVRVINWEGEQAIQSAVIDVTEARSLSEQLAYQASHDMLTGLLNRRAFEQRLQQLLETAQAEKIEHALCYLDLDQFKIINDTCGHTAGDELLRQIGRVLQQQVRGRDTLARLGGDEFGILLERCSVTRAQRVTTAMRTAVEGFRFAWEEQSFTIGASIGVVPINETSASMTHMLSMADAACYAAKDAGRNRVHIYRDDDAELAKRRGEMHWVAVINRAL